MLSAIIITCTINRMKLRKWLLGSIQNAAFLFLMDVNLTGGKETLFLNIYTISLRNIFARILYVVYISTKTIIVLLWFS